VAEIPKSKCQNPNPKRTNSKCELNKPLRTLEGFNRSKQRERRKDFLTTDRTDFHGWGFRRQICEIREQEAERRGAVLPMAVCVRRVLKHGPGSGGNLQTPIKQAQSSRSAEAIGKRAARMAGKIPPIEPIIIAHITPKASNTGVTRKAKAIWLNVCQLMVEVLKPLKAK
jgi:hypothetical protein